VGTDGSDLFEDVGTADGNAVTGRVTYVPIKSADHVLHFGVAQSNRDEDVDITGLEVAYSNGSYHIQSEFRSSEENDASREGLYFQSGWIITDETSLNYHCAYPRLLQMHQFILAPCLIYNIKLL
jgi:phosphate-selective porin OprO/OprP